MVSGEPTRLQEPFWLPSLCDRIKSGFCWVIWGSVTWGHSFWVTGAAGGVQAAERAVGSPLWRRVWAEDPRTEKHSARNSTNASPWGSEAKTRTSWKTLSWPRKRSYRQAFGSLAFPFFSFKRPSAQLNRKISYIHSFFIRYWYRLIQNHL